MGTLRCWFDLFLVQGDMYSDPFAKNFREGKSIVHIQLVSRELPPAPRLHLILSSQC